MPPTRKSIGTGSWLGALALGCCRSQVRRWFGRQLPRLYVRSCDASIDLQELDRCPVVLDKRHHHPGAGAVRLNDDVLALNRFRQVVNLESEMRNRFDEGWVRGVGFRAYPFDAIGVLAVLADAGDRGFEEIRELLLEHATDKR